MTILFPAYDPLAGLGSVVHRPPPVCPRFPPRILGCLPTLAVATLSFFSPPCRGRPRSFTLLSPHRFFFKNQCQLPRFFNPNHPPQPIPYTPLFFPPTAKSTAPITSYPVDFFFPPPFTKLMTLLRFFHYHVCFACVARWKGPVVEETLLRPMQQPVFPRDPQLSLVFFWTPIPLLATLSPHETSLDSPFRPPFPALSVVVFLLDSIFPKGTVLQGTLGEHDTLFWSLL